MLFWRIIHKLVTTTLMYPSYKCFITLFKIFIRSDILSYFIMLKLDVRYTHDEVKGMNPKFIIVVFFNSFKYFLYLDFSHNRFLHRV